MLIAGKSGSQSPASSTPTLTLGSSESLNDPNPGERLADFYARDANVPSSNDQSGCSATDDDVVEHCRRELVRGQIRCHGVEIGSVDQ